MDLFGMGTVQDNQATNMLKTHGFEQSKGSATLFLFSQRNLPNQFRRPYSYQFNPTFRMALDQTVERALRQPSNYMSSAMLDVPAARSAILPTAQGQEINLKPLCECWTFVLILDNNTGISPLGLPSSMPTRMLYSGWVLGEPVTRRNFSAGYVYNPSALLVTTHHTTLCVQQSFGLNQTFKQINTTGDYDYYSGQMMQQLTPSQNELYDLRLSRLANNILPSVETSSFQVAPDAVTIADPTTQKTTREISTDVNNPTSHLQKIVGSIVDSIKVSQQPDVQGNIDVFAGGDVVLGNFATFVGGGQRNVVLNKFNPSEPIPMEALEREFSTDLNVTVCDIPRDSTYELSNPAIPSKRNVFTNMLATSLPALLAQFGLAEIAFRYNSVAKPTEFFPDPNTVGIFRVENIATLYGVDDRTQMDLCWQNLERYLRTCLFPVIRDNAGEFDVMVHCSLAGVSLINLNLLDDLQVEYGMQENNNLLGGLNTPFVGTMNDFQNNAGQLFTVIKDVSSVGQPPLNLGPAGMPLPTF